MYGYSKCHHLFWVKSCKTPVWSCRAGGPPRPSPCLSSSLHFTSLKPFYPLSRSKIVRASKKKIGRETGSLSCVPPIQDTGQGWRGSCTKNGIDGKETSHLFAIGRKQEIPETWGQPHFARESLMTRRPPAPPLARQPQGQPSLPESG